jgi:hypothetical protein
MNTDVAIGTVLKLWACHVVGLRKRRNPSAVTPEGGCAIVALEAHGEDDGPL